MANTVLRKDYSGAGNKQRQTISVWVKRCAGLGGNQAIFSVRHTGNSNYYGYLRFKTDNSLQYYLHNTSVSLRTRRLFKDTNAWYHIVITLDTTQSTEADRLKMYINGVEETSFETATYPSQNAEVTFGDDYRHEIGSYDSSYYFEGVMSHFYFITNTAYQASTFGSTDSTTGEWQINTSPTITYATNSFFILKDGNSVTDLSGQGNNYTVAGGTLTKTEDNPSNVFAIGNILIGRHSNGADLLPSYSQGGLTALADGSVWKIFKSTLGASSGKYYAEFKWISDSNTRYSYIGLYDEDAYAQKISGYPYMADMANCYGLKDSNGNINSGASSTSYGVSYSTGNIIGVAADLDNNKLYFSKDGVWMNSANPSSGTGGYSITANKTYKFGIQMYAVGNITFSANFGNGYFGTTAVSSAGTNASGNGIFEYDVPTGYTALSTKGLNI